MDMYTLLLVFWTWPLWFAAAVTFAFRERLNRPAWFFWGGLAACVIAEVALSFGYLQVIVVPLISFSGFLVHLCVGAGILYLFYERDKRIAAEKT